MRKIAAVVVVLLAPALARAEVVTLKDGTTLRGSVVSEDTAVVVKLADGSVRIDKSEVARIDFGGDVARPAPVAATSRARIDVELKTGYHAYGGAGWSSDASKFSGPAVEVAAPIEAFRAATWSLSLVPTVGFYGGQGSTSPGGFGGGYSTRLENTYLLVGPRASLSLGSVSLYGELGAGGYQSHASSGYGASTRTTAAAYALAGVGAPISHRFGVFGQVKGATANGSFRGGSSIDMGGALVLVGIDVAFGR